MTKIRNDFAVFILSNGRADNVLTLKSLRKFGYTGKIYLLIDDQDKQIKQYKENFGDKVIIFPKQKAIEISDSGDNFNQKNTVLYARNYNFIIAKQLGIKYFLQLDDDYTEFRYAFNNHGDYITKNIYIKNLDVIISAMLEFYIVSKAKSIAMAQGGDFIGGGGSGLAKIEIKGKFGRKLMNSFFCCTDRPFKFLGRMNDDVNTYVTRGLRGDLFITIPRIRLEQKQTQSSPGGLTEMYLDFGTYTKSFYSVMYAPSCVKISAIGVSNRRLHHRVSWKNCVPNILSEDIKK